MLQIFLYAVAVSAALSLVGLVDSRVPMMRNMPRRVFCVLAMVLSVAWPLAMLLWSRPVTVMAPQEPMAFVQAGTQVDTLSDVQVTATRAVQGLEPTSTSMRPGTSPSAAPIADGTLLAAWAMLAGGLLLYLAFAAVLLARRAARWTQAEVQGREVLVSDTTGPALVGVLRPRIVVPRWFLDEPAAKQKLILEHEEQHVAAHDPLLYRLALLIAVALPWNLPLWWQLRRLRQAIELDCDARVLRGGAAPDAYGEVLLEVTRRSGEVPVGAVAMGEPVSALELRVRNLVPDPRRRSVGRVVVALLLGMGGFAVAASLDPPQLPASSNASAAAQEEEAARAAQLQKRLTELQADLETRTMTMDVEALQKQAAVESQKAGQAQQQEKLAALEQLARERESARVREKVLREKVSSLVAAQASAATQAAPVAQAVAKDERPTMELLDLITMAGGRFKKQFIVDPRVGGSVNVDTLAVNSLTYHAFLEVLGVHGFVAVPSGDVVTIIPEDYATRVASPIVNVEDIKGDDAEVVTALIPAGENSMQLNPILRQIVPKWGFVQAMPDQKSLLVVDRVANVKRLAALVRAQDKPQ